MLILSRNTYFKIGFSALLEHSIINTRSADHGNVVIYDRGDGFFSVLSEGNYALLQKDNVSLFQYIMWELPIFDSRINLQSDMNEFLGLILRSAKLYYPHPDKRKQLREHEQQLLRAYFSGDTINIIAKRTPGISLVTFRSRKNQALRRLGNLPSARMVKLLHNWSHFFNKKNESS
ncbi:hypothetical protein [Enterobacter ludwigii]|uniref:hypothetical protein n=1 Tax=Enterobacter ludwigii TaxID=299767 RepID=UPI003F5B9149